MAFVSDIFKGDGGISSLTCDAPITISGSNRYIFVAIYAEGVTVSSVSTGAQTPTAISGAVLNPYGSDIWQIYGLANPTVGTPTPTVAFSGTATRAFIYAIAWDDVGTLGTPSTLYSDTVATPSSLNATSAASQTVLDFIVASALTITNDGSQALREQRNDFAGVGRSFGSSSKAAIGSTTNMLWTPGDVCDMQHIAIPFSAAGGGGASFTNQKLVLLGVG